MVFSLDSCKKKTDIKVIVFNPVTNTYKPNTSIQIIKFSNKHVGTIAGARTWVQDGEVFSKETDGTGTIVVNDLKLKKGDNVRYQIHAYAPPTASTNVYLMDVIKAGEENTITFNADW